MISIIRHGTPYRFECDVCGCVWTASMEDIVADQQTTVITGEWMYCPDCHSTVDGKKVTRK